MTSTVQRQRGAADPPPLRTSSRRRAPAAMLRSTDHKTIGKMYLVTSLFFFLCAGLMALLMRAELARPGMQFLTPELYNQLFTIHGTLMLLLYATPLAFAFANLLVPLQIGAPDVAFPRLNAFSYYAFLFGGLMVLGSFLTPEGAPGFGWFAYAPLNDAMNTPTIGANLWIIGLVFSGLGTILAAVNVITTVITLRAPGMTMFRMPIFTWNMLVTSLLVLMAFPELTAALLALWMRWRGAPWPSLAQWRNAFVVGALMLGGGMGGTANAEVSIGSGLVVAFIAVIPLLIALMNLIWGVRPSRLEAAGIALGLVGVLMLTQGSGFRSSPEGLIAICIAPVLVAITLGIPAAILAESGLSFLGLGVQPPHATWGNILSEGKDAIEIGWWLSVYPGLAILVTVLSYNLLGEGIRDALDPRLRQSVGRIVSRRR